MTSQLVECIPNFSEARRGKVIDQLLQAIQSVSGVSVLDRHSDMDHNRTVITLAGEPGQVEEAVFQAVKLAGELINMEEHTGGHPRVGATDVVPFVPLRGVTMEDCVALARRLAERVGNELNIPVYLYEEAAIRPENQNLENIRKGQYEGLKQEIQTNPDRKPDFGPSQLGQAGATVIGARQPLVAYNIYLSTSDLSIAQKIARAVRHSSGGFRYVKAMGVIVDGLAQVSMNLTNYQSTPIARVQEVIRREALSYGVTIQHAELVGLVPQNAILEAAKWYLQLKDFSGDQILENNVISEVMSDTKADTEQDLLEQLSSANPTPGGGSAGAHVGAVAAALVTMVARLTIGKKKYLDVEKDFVAIMSRSEAIRAKLTQAVSADAQAFDNYMQALRLPKDSANQAKARTDALEQALLHAASVPFDGARLSLEVLEMALFAVKHGNLNAISDAGSAAAFALASFNSAAMNVRTNLINLTLQPEATHMLDELDAFQAKANALNDQVVLTIKSRGGL